MTLGKRSDYGDSKYAGLVVPFPSTGEGGVDQCVQVGGPVARLHA